MSEIAPIYLISSERSGTNFLRKRLTEHNNIYFGGSPAPFLKHLFYREPLFYGNLNEDDNFLALINDALDLCYIHFSPWEIKLTKEEVLEGYSKEYDIRNSVLLAHYLMLRYAQFKGFQSYFCKDNFIYEFAWQIFYYIPNAKFIYLYRDPRDYALSQLKRTAMTNNLFRISRLWQYEQIKCISILYHLKKAVITVSYEDLIQDERYEIGRICRFLGIEMIENRKKVEDINLGTTEEWQNLNKPTMKNNFNKYKKELSKKQVEIIENICWNEMKYLGYKTESKNRPKIKFKKLHRFFHIFCDVLSNKLKILNSNDVRNKNRDLMSKRNKKLKDLYVNYRIDK